MQRIFQDKGVFVMGKTALRIMMVSLALGMLTAFSFSPVNLTFTPSLKKIIFRQPLKLKGIQLREGRQRAIEDQYNQAWRAAKLLAISA